MSNYEFDEISVLKLFQNLQDPRRKPLMQHEVLLKVVFDSLWQGWAISGPRAKCGPPRRFQWPAEAFRKDLQTYIPPTYLIFLPTFNSKCLR